MSGLEGGASTFFLEVTASTAPVSTHRYQIHARTHRNFGTYVHTHGTYKPHVRANTDAHARGCAHKRTDTYITYAQIRVYVRAVVRTHVQTSVRPSCVSSPRARAPLYKQPVN